MKIIKKLAIPIITLLLLSVMTIGYLNRGQTLANAAPRLQNTDVNRTITVVGEGRITAQPDIAQITIGVEAFSPEVQSAAQEVETTMTKLIETLTAQGVAEKDIQTSNYSVYTDQFGGRELGGSEVNYRFNNNVTVTVRDLDNVETILAAVIEAGANNIYGVNFSVEDPAELRKQARAEAVKVAQDKAAELATLNDVTIGDVVSVSEVVDSAGAFRNSAALSNVETVGGGGPINPGELVLKVQLQISYAIQ